MESKSIEQLHAEKMARWALALIILVVALFVTSIVCLCLGTIYIPPGKVLAILIGNTEGASPAEVNIIQQVREPRIVMAGLVGACLSIAGTALQGIFKNPMASPSVIGISQGAAFGASLMIVLGFTLVAGNFAIPVSAFVFAMVTLLLVYMLGRVEGALPTTTLLLAGIAVGAFFSAMVSLLQILAAQGSTGTMERVVFWLMGSLNTANWTQTWIVLAFLIPGFILLFAFSRDLNAMIVGETHATSLGVDPKNTVKIMLFGSALVTGAAVAFTGVIAFVGLIVPHIMRMIIGPDNRILFPASLLAGAIFLIATDTVARTIMAPQELPVGVITSLMGAPFFLYLLRRRKEATEW
ncbi:MAG TPA: iron chelate uptake ABC transporter family permease subunit [Methanomassiliicoccales archaeon]|nr:iron chelate uptake ABC transporter family permease subunit [Methanomassiliicoccales archaeon]